MHCPRRCTSRSSQRLEQWKQEPIQREKLGRKSVMKDPLTKIEANLWSAGISPDKYPDGAFQNHLLEQYKLYVEMADRISQRRGTANTFFLTVNTAIIGALGTFIK